MQRKFNNWPVRCEIHIIRNHTTKKYTQRYYDYYLLYDYANGTNPLVTQSQINYYYFFWIFIAQNVTGNYYLLSDCISRIQFIYFDNFDVIGPNSQVGFNFYNKEFIFIWWLVYWISTQNFKLKCYADKIQFI